MMEGSVCFLWAYSVVFRDNTYNLPAWPHVRDDLHSCLTEMNPDAAFLHESLDLIALQFPDIAFDSKYVLVEAPRCSQLLRMSYQRLWPWSRLSSCSCTGKLCFRSHTQGSVASRGARCDRTCYWREAPVGQHSNARVRPRNTVFVMLSVSLSSSCSHL